MHLDSIITGSNNISHTHGWQGHCQLVRHGTFQSQDPLGWPLLASELFRLNVEGEPVQGNSEALFSVCIQPLVGLREQLGSVLKDAIYKETVLTVESHERYGWSLSAELYHWIFFLFNYEFLSNDVELVISRRKVINKDNWQLYSHFLFSRHQSRIKLIPACCESFSLLSTWALPCFYITSLLTECSDFNTSASLCLSLMSFTFCHQDGFHGPLLPWIHKDLNPFQHGMLWNAKSMLLLLWHLCRRLHFLLNKVV